MFNCRNYDVILYKHKAMACCSKDYALKSQHHQFTPLGLLSNVLNFCSVQLSCMVHCIKVFAKGVNLKSVESVQPLPYSVCPLNEVTTFSFSCALTVIRYVKWLAHRYNFRNVHTENKMPLPALVIAALGLFMPWTACIYPNISDSARQYIDS